MIRSISFLFVLSTFFSSDQLPTDHFPPIEETFPKNWESTMGIASYRTNIVLNGDMIIMGSNGEGFNDADILDKQSGVYLINRRNGKQIRKIGSKVFGDMDVNGVLLYDNKIYYGNDNEEFICSTIDGKIVWRNPVSGDVEHQPTLLNNNGKKIIVYGTEVGEVTALDPTNGKIIWSYYSPNFSGWKPTDNRMLFKVKSYFSWGRVFFTKPTLFDINKDGVEDLLYSNYSITAIDGKNGKPIWRKLTDADSFCVSPIIVQKQVSDIQLSYVQYNRSQSSYVGTYSLITIDRKGKFISKKYLYQSSNYPDDILNKLTTEEKETIFTIGDSAFVIDNTNEVKAYNYAVKYMNKRSYRDDSTYDSRHYYESLVANKEFSYKNNNRCILILNQTDSKSWSNGFISILSLDNGQILDSWELPHRTEFPPLIEDINKDGKQDLLINCFDGKLYCYTLSNLKFK